MYGEHLEQGGDLDYDGEYDIYDLLILVDILLGFLNPDIVLNHVSDINQDGETNYSDLFKLLFYILNH